MLKSQNRRPDPILSGNLTQDAESRKFSYNGENKQTEVRDAYNQVTATYEYDGDGNRVRKTLPATGEVTIFVYDADGDLSAEYAANVPPIPNPTTNYLTADALGSPRVITDNFGNVVGRRDFMPFGEDINSGVGNRTSGQKYDSDSIPQRFTRKERDKETGLDYFEARYYSSRWGRFTTSDEFVGGPEELIEFDGMLGHNPTFYAELAEPQSLNKYQYALNNPLRYVDPDGHQTTTADRVVPLPPWMWVTPAQAKAIGKWIEDNVNATVEGAKQFTKEILDANGRYGRSCSVMMECPSNLEKQYLKNEDAANQDETPTNSSSTQQGSSSNAAKPRGSLNPNTRKRLEEGKQRHKELKERTKKKAGWKSEPSLKDPKTGKTIRPDVVTKSGRPLELKPNTPSGRNRGKKQLPAQERATGKKGRVIYYEPKK